MPNYILSQDNRHYVVLETNAGSVPPVAMSNRFLANKLNLRTEIAVPERKDKTGTRTFLGEPNALRSVAQFHAKTYHCANLAHPALPSVSPFYQSAMGASPTVFAGAVVDAGSSGTQIRTTMPNNLQVGQGISYGGELRFVTSVLDSQSVLVNAPFSTSPATGATLGSATTYSLGKTLPTFSIFDYWFPNSSIQRIATGGVVDRMKIAANGDYHEVEFRGPAIEVIDSLTFTPGAGQLSSFPQEPPPSGILGSPVPGHLGQAWLGSVPQQFFTVTEATVEVDNAIDVRNREFGSVHPRCYVPGKRRVTVSTSLYTEDRASSSALYQAARSRIPVPFMLQLGQMPGQLLGIMVKNLTLSIPEYDDRETRLVWRLEECVAQGTSDDEITIALG